ncbi:MAG: metallophosphoesterase, partial [Thiohalomonadales bacterium]
MTNCSLEPTPSFDHTDLKVPPITTPTANPNILKFIVMGDVGTSTPAQYKVANAVKSLCDNKGCDFVMLLGDNIYQTGVDSIDDEQFRSKFEEPYQDIDVPFHMVLGNHDYGSGGIGLEIQKAWYQVAYTNKSNKWKMPHHYYRYRLNQTDFFAVDTQAQYLGVDNTQQKKVSAWINDSNATWKIVYGH